MQSMAFIIALTYKALDLSRVSFIDFDMNLLLQVRLIASWGDRITHIIRYMTHAAAFAKVI